MDKIIRILKNWWLALSAGVLLILDFGLDAINPILITAGLSKTGLIIVKIIFGFYGLYKLKKQTPTQNPEKLKNIANKMADAPPGDGAVQPGKGM